MRNGKLYYNDANPIPVDRRQFLTFADDLAVLIGDPLLPDPAGVT